MSVNQMQDSGVKAETIAHFIWHNEKHATNPNTPDAQARRDELKDTIIVVDETSMVSNRDMLKMLTIAEALGIEKIALIGDRQQLLPIDAGKAFAMMQADKIGMARMDDNLRQQTDQLRTVAALANIGKAGQAMKVLGDKVVENEDPSAHASDLWLRDGRRTMAGPRHDIHAHRRARQTNHRGEQPWSTLTGKRLRPSRQSQM